MQQRTRASQRPLAIGLATAIVATLGLSACGGSSGSSSAATHANVAAILKQLRAKSAVAHGGAQGGSSANAGVSAARPGLTALRDCLHKHGVELPTRPGGAGLLGGAHLPRGVSRAQLRATLGRCLGPGLHAGAASSARNVPRSANPRFRQALSAFAACMRAHGVSVPKPNSTGAGPVFSTKGLNTSSPQFKAATAKCRLVLVGALGLRGARPGASGSTAQSPQPAG